MTPSWQRRLGDIRRARVASPCSDHPEGVRGQPARHNWITRRDGWGYLSRIVSVEQRRGGGVVLGTLTVRHGAESAGRARRHLADELVRRGFPDAVIQDAALLLTELVSNAVRYARPLPGGVLRIGWELVGSKLLLRVTDGGSSGGPHRQAAGPRDTRGRGLAIVEAVAARWGTEHAAANLNTVWAELPLPAPGPWTPELGRF
jgi:anti-sigma regulatory factor (Ser/Thr protein kinase)